MKIDRTIKFEKPLKTTLLPQFPHKSIKLPNFSLRYAIKLNSLISKLQKVFSDHKRISNLPYNVSLEFLYIITFRLYLKRHKKSARIDWKFELGGKKNNFDEWRDNEPNTVWFYAYTHNIFCWLLLDEKESWMKIIWFWFDNGPDDYLADYYELLGSIQVLTWWYDSFKWVFNFASDWRVFFCLLFNERTFVTFHRRVAKENRFLYMDVIYEYSQSVSNELHILACFRNKPLSIIK